MINLEIERDADEGYVAGKNRGGGVPEIAKGGGERRVGFLITSTLYLYITCFLSIKC